MALRNSLVRRLFCESLRLFDRKGERHLHCRVGLDNRWQAFVTFQLVAGLVGHDKMQAQVTYGGEEVAKGTARNVIKLVDDHVGAAR